jgi:hypothetical protein
MGRSRRCDPDDHMLVPLLDEPGDADRRGRTGCGDRRLTDFDLYARGAETMLAAWEEYARARPMPPSGACPA